MSNLSKTRCGERIPLLTCGNKAGLVQNPMVLCLCSKVHAVLAVGSGSIPRISKSFARVKVGVIKAAGPAWKKGCYSAPLPCRGRCSRVKALKHHFFQQVCWELETWK